MAVGGAGRGGPMKGAGAACALACVTALALLAAARQTTLWDRDEPRFAEAGVEMVASGHYLVPTFNGELRAQKPPLVYWLMAGSVLLLGKSELAVRFWSPLALALAGLATFAIGRRLWSPTVGLLAMAIVMLNPLSILEALAATTDALLLASLTASAAILVEAFHRPPGWRDAALLGLAIGVALLTKGPVGLVMPMGIALVAWWLARTEITWPRAMAIMLATASAIGIAMFAAWVVPASLATDGRIAWQGLFRENVGRALAPMEGHGVRPALALFYYPIVIVAGFVPWTLFLPAALARTATAASRRSRAGALLLAWMMVPLVLFTAAATKLPHYILPIWPALALIVAASIAGESPADHRVARAAGLILAVATLAAEVVALVVAGRLRIVEGMDAAGPLTAALLVAVTVPAFVLFGRRRNLAAAGSLCAGVAIVLVWIAVGVAPLVDAAKPVPFVAELARAAVSPDAPVFAYRFEEPSLVFYSGRRLVTLSDDRAVAAWAREPGAAVLVAPRPAIAAVERTYSSLGLRELGAKRGWNYPVGREVELVAFMRPAGR